MQQALQDLEDKAAKGRISARLPVVAAVQLTVGDAYAHAVVLDASPGGLRLQLAGVAAGLVTMPTVAQTQELCIGILFLQHGLRELGTLQANIRWVRPDAQGCTLGVQLLSDSHAQQKHVLKILQADENRIAQRRQRLGAVSVGLVLVAMAAMAMQHADQMEVLENNSTIMTQNMQQLHESLRLERGRAQEQARKLHTLHDDLEACQAKADGVATQRWVDVAEHSKLSAPDAEDAPPDAEPSANHE